jgi:hypothetical protein
MESIDPLTLIREEHLLQVEQSPRTFPGLVQNLAQELIGDGSQDEILMAMSGVRDTLNQQLDKRKAQRDQVFNMTAYCKQPGAVRNRRMQ